MVGFWNLIVVWLKLLIPWRFFRLWALADGMDAPENMVRCMANNYSALGFWRSWHRSYNLWIVRYLYIPVGGSTRPILSTLAVFTFVALWHDLSLKLLTWGWLISLFVIPEMAARQLLPPSKYAQEPWYRHVCAIGGVFNILMMMAANLVGFVVGVSGTRHLADQLFGSWQGLQFLGFACVCLFIAVQVMFEYRYGLFGCTRSTSFFHRCSYPQRGRNAPWHISPVLVQAACLGNTLMIFIMSRRWYLCLCHFSRGSRSIVFASLHLNVP